MTTYPIVAEVSVNGLGDMAKLEGAAKGVDSAADGATSALRRMGKVTKTTGATAEDMAGQFRAMGESGTFAGDTLERAGLIMSGPLGAAIAGSVIAIGGLTAAVSFASEGFQKLIDDSEDLTAAQTRLASTYDDVQMATVRTVLTEQDHQNLLTGLDVQLGKVQKSLESNAQTHGAYQRAMTVTGRRNQDLIGAFKSLIPVIGIADLALTGFIRVGHEHAVAMKYATSATAATVNILGQIPSAASSAASSMRAAISSFGEMIGLVDKSNPIMQALGAGVVIPGLKKLGGAIEKATGGARKRGGGGGGGGGRLSIQDRLQITPQMEANRARLQERADDQALLAEMTRAAEKAADAQIALDQNMAATLARTAALDQQAQSLNGTMIATDGIFTSLGQQSAGIFVNTMGQALDTTTAFFGALMAGEGTMSTFARSMAQMAGSVAGTFGDLFVKTGVGMAFVNPAAGAGLIAAGLALKTFGSFVSSKASSGGGGGGGGRSSGGGAAARSTVTRELARSLRAPDRRGGRNETLVLQIGEEQIAATVRRVVNGQMRLNRIGRRAL